MTTKRLNAYERDPKVINETIRSLQQLDDGITTFGRSLLDDADADAARTTLGLTYTAGSWTPALNFGGATTGITYATQVGRYVRIADLVTVWARIVLTSSGSATGDATIEGLPLTSSNISGLTYTGLLGDFSNLSLSEEFHCAVSANSTSVRLLIQGSGTDDTIAVDHTSIDNDAALSISLTYRTG